MLKVLIADDEELIRQLIKHLVPWDELGLQIVGEADNGYAAYDCILDEKPDIAVLDIRMPGFNGLELIHKIREAGLDIYFILVSGYKQFEYAHEAMELGIRDYLLKPIKKADLVQNLEKARDSILSKRQIAAEQVNMQQEFQKSRERLRLRLIQDLPYSGETYSIESLNQEFHFQFREGLFQFCIFHLTPPAQTITQDWAEDLSALGSLMKPFFKEACFDWETSCTKHEIVALLNYEPQRSAEIMKWLRGLLLRWGDQRGNLWMSTLTIAVGRPFADTARLRPELAYTWKCMRARPLCRPERIIYGEKMPPETRSVHDVLTDPMLREFSGLVEVGQTKELKNWVAALYTEAFHGTDPLAPTLLSELTGEVIRQYQKLLRKLHGSTETFDAAPYLARCSDADELGELTRALNDMIDTQQDSGTSQNNAFVRYAKEYVKTHYGESIHLTAIAANSNVHPAYLSRIFKEETGENFSDYLIGYRMQVAKELLRDISINISEVAERGGYCDSKHFGKSFKAAVGLTPKDYRKLYAR